jgi:TPR repeat protein
MSREAGHVRSSYNKERGLCELLINRSRSFENSELSENEAVRLTQESDSEGMRLDIVIPNCQQGNTFPAARLGTMLFLSKGIRRSTGEATKLRTWAAEQGNSEAQFNLVELYLTGCVVPRDLAKAY